MITVRHTFPEVKGTCPVNGDADSYKIVIEFTYEDDSLLEHNPWYIETILEDFAEITKDPISQEELTIKIAREYTIYADANGPQVTEVTVKTEGNHGDVRTDTEITI